MHCTMNWPQKVKALAPIHPAPGAPASLIYAPMMVPTGALDFVTSPMLVKTAVFDGSPSPKIMPIMNGVAHREPVNYAGANRWNGYLTAFFTLYLKQDLRAAMLIWGEEVGSLSKDSRISVAHRNKGSAIWLEATTADLNYGEVASVTGKITKTLALTRGAHYKLEAFQRLEEGFDVDVGFEILSTNEYEIDFMLHMSPTSAASKLEQKLTVIAINTNDGGSVSFHDIFLKLGSSTADVPAFSEHRASHLASNYDNQRHHVPVGTPERPPMEDRSSQVASFDEESWMSLTNRKRDKINKKPVSGTRFTVVEDEIQENIANDNVESWADVLYSSSKKMQTKPKPSALPSLLQNQMLGDNVKEEDLGQNLWKEQLFPSSNVPTSLLPWESLLNSDQRDRGSLVLGVSDYPVGYGDAQYGKPTPKERDLMVWINTIRGSPETFQGAYLTRGCSFAAFERDAKVTQEPLHFSTVLSKSAQKHSHDMANQNFVSHIGVGDSTPFERMDDVGYSRGYRGENICAGMKNPFDCVISFMCSKDHRENIMSDTFREMGVGLSSKLASQYKHYWTLNLGHSGIVEHGRFVSSFDQSLDNL